MGKPYPGHRVAVIDENGRECPAGVSGDVALHRLDVHGQPDPIFFWVTGRMKLPPSPSSLGPGAAPVIWLGAMKTVTCGTRADQTTCSRRPVIGLVRGD